jgi:RNA polymerase sigma factor (sigma-70 family)
MRVVSLSVSLTVRERTWHRRRAVSAGSAMAEAVRAHEGLLRGTARRLCGNDADADDLVHDTYERALRGWERYADRGNLKAWLMTIMHNLFIDRCRRIKRQPQTEEVSEAVAAPEIAPPPAWSNVTSEQVTSALVGIGAEFRSVCTPPVARTTTSRASSASRRRRWARGSCARAISSRKR